MEPGAPWFCRPNYSTGRKHNCLSGADKLPRWQFGLTHPCIAIFSFFPACTQIATANHEQPLYFIAVIFSELSPKSEGFRCAKLVNTQRPNAEDINATDQIKTKLLFASRFATYGTKFKSLDGGDPFRW